MQNCTISPMSWSMNRDVSLTITNEDGRDFNYTFNRTTNAYTLSAGVLPSR